MLVVAVLAVAYGASAPDLAVAEFAPTARQGLEAPPTTGSEQRAGQNAGGRRAPTTTAPAAATTGTGADGSGGSPPTTKVGRARECFGDPPRQAEDLMAPACLATIFEGDNGGATSRGVSSTEIRIAVPVNSQSFVTSTDANTRAQRDTIQAVFDYVNRRFELYGRRLVPVYVAGPARDAVTSRTLAAQVHAAGVFGAVTGPLERLAETPQSALVQELARNKIVTVALNRAAWWSDRTLFDPYHPYLWSVYPSAEQLQGQLAGLACALGPNADFAPGADLAGKPRRFAVVAAGTQLAPAAGHVTAAIEACTGSVPSRLDWTQAAGSPALRTGVTRLAAEGVTSLVCICEHYLIEQVLIATLGQTYDPEWIYPTSGYWGGDEYWMQQIRSNGWFGGAIQVQSGPRLVPLQARPWYQALLVANPALVSSGRSQLAEAFQFGEATYSQLLVLASGLQAAGPQLTPDTFAAGLMTTQFPNPGAGQAPAWQPSVGFGPGDHAFYDDFAVGWWSMSVPAVEPTGWPEGSWCYAGGGARYRAGTVPADLRLRLYDEDEPCR